MASRLAGREDELLSIVPLDTGPTFQKNETYIGAPELKTGNLQNLSLDHGHLFDYSYKERMT